MHISKKLNIKNQDNNFQLRINEGLSLFYKGKINESEIIFKQLISEGCNDPNLYCNLAAICGINGKESEMLKLLVKALEIDSNHIESLNNLGLLYLDQNKEISKAIYCFKRALSINPKYFQAYNNLGSAYLEVESYQQAIDLFQKCLKVQPNFFQAHNNLGIAYKAIRKFEESINSFQNALNINPNFFESLNGIARSYQELGRFYKAEKFYRKALKINPNSAEIHTNLGSTLYEMNDFKGSIKYYMKAICLKPSLSEAHNCLSLSLLILGDYDKGLKEYEWRFRFGEKYQYDLLMNTKPPNSKQWNGEKLNHGEKLLIIGEQGFGDVIQFMRYVLFLKDKNINIIFCAPEELHELIIASGFEVDFIKPNQVPFLKNIKWIPLLSIPRIIGVKYGKPIIDKPYISSSQKLKKKWGQKLLKERKPIIAINWQGNPSHELTYVKGRSLPLECFSLISNTSSSLLSLQKQWGSEQLATCSFKDSFVSVQKEISDIFDFHETAAIIENCDLVITCDTSIAHLAGGLGKTTWLLLRDLPEWRWGLNTEKTFWYPSMRLFRQKERDNWTEVLERVSKELNSFFQK